MKISDTDIRDAFFDEIYAIAAKDKNVLFLTADMGALSLSRFKADLSSRYLNIGVAEQNLISVAAGLALVGKKVFVYSIAPFATQRCFEQIKVDLCGMNLPVTIIGSGPGISYSSDGPTHHATQDVAVMRSLPEMTILNPADSVAAAAAARIAYASTGPVYVRVDKGKLPLLYDNDNDFSAGLACLKEGRDLTIVTMGLMVHQAFKVVEELGKHAIDSGIIDVYRLKPINEELLLKFIEQARRVVTLEEHSLVGGLGSAVSEIFVDNRKALSVKRIALSEENCPGYGDRDWMHSFYGLDVESISRTVLEWVRSNDTKRSNDTYSELSVEDFARLLGISVDDIPEDCRQLITQTDFRYRILRETEKDDVMLRVLKTINSDSLSVVGPQRKQVWENGWSENLRNFTNSNYDLNELIPKFVKTSEVERLEGNYIMPSNPQFETSFVTVLRRYLFRKYFSDFPSICEFGCGTGLNLVALATLYPDKKLYGLDWVKSSCDTINKIAETKNLKLSGILFDMFSPDSTLDIPLDSAVFTIGAMEQLGKNFEPFLLYLLRKRFPICINIETLYELYDQSDLFDYVAAKYLERRGYLQGYLNKLRQLESEGKIEIIKVQRTFGTLYHDGYSYIVWKPKA